MLSILVWLHSVRRHQSPKNLKSLAASWKITTFDSTANDSVLPFWDIIYNILCWLCPFYRPVPGLLYCHINLVELGLCHSLPNLSSSMATTSGPGALCVADFNTAPLLVWSHPSINGCDSISCGSVSISIFHLRHRVVLRSILSFWNLKKEWTPLVQQIFHGEVRKFTDSMCECWDSI